MLHKIISAIACAAIISSSCLGASSKALKITQERQAKQINLSQTWDKTFKLNKNVAHQKVRFINRFGITLAADLYYPKNIKEGAKLPAIAISGPFGAVKEQSSGLYANELASRGFITLAFDPSYTGESGGAGGVRNVASPDINTEDFSAAVDFLALQSFVDSDKIGILGICGFGGMGVNATLRDTRIKAFVGVSLYDMSRSMGHGVGENGDAYGKKERKIVLNYLNNARLDDIKNAKYAGGLHEIYVDEKGVAHPEAKTLLPEVLPANPRPVLKQFYEYYRTPRGFHERSINSNGIWNATMPLSFMSIKMDDYADEIDQSVLLIAGQNAHSLYFSKDVIAKMKGDNKELMVVKGAHHVDLYDQKDKIPFNKIESFYKANLK